MKESKRGMLRHEATFLYLKLQVRLSSACAVYKSRLPGVLANIHLGLSRSANQRMWGISKLALNISLWTNPATTLFDAELRSQTLKCTYYRKWSQTTPPRKWAESWLFTSGIKLLLSSATLTSRSSSNTSPQIWGAPSQKRMKTRKNSR